MVQVLLNPPQLGINANKWKVSYASFNFTSTESNLLIGSDAFVAVLPHLSSDPGEISLNICVAAQMTL